MSETLQRLLSERPLTTDAWVQCDSCQVWRRVPQLVAERLGENHAWFCHQNLDQKFSTCDDPQELEDHEIDVLMQAQEAAANAKARGSGRDGSGPRVRVAGTTHAWARGGVFRRPLGPTRMSLPPREGCSPRARHSHTTTPHHGSARHQGRSPTILLAARERTRCRVRRRMRPTSPSALNAALTTV